MVEGFNSLDEMMEAMRTQEQAANAAAYPWQQEITWGSYFMRPMPEYGFVIFGSIPSKEEFLAMEAPKDDPNYRAEVDEEWNGPGGLMERGYRFAQHFSVAEPDGEWGSTHVSTMIPITVEDFEFARAALWEISPISDWVVERLQRLFSD